MDAPTLIDRLTRLVPGASFEPGTATDQPTIHVPRAHLVDVCRCLRDEPDLQFRFLADLTAVDWLPREPRFEVVYHLASLGVPVGSARPSQIAGGRVPPARRLRLKVRVPGDDRTAPTVSRIWATAGWLEREVYDLFGIVFEDHPDLRRVLMPDDWEGHPLCKDYPVQINQRVRSSSPLQVTEEEFVANISAARRHATPHEGGGGDSGP